MLVRELSDDEKKKYVATVLTLFFVQLLFVAHVLALHGWTTIGFAAGGTGILAGLLLIFVVPQEVSEELASRIYMGGPVNSSRDGRSQIEAEVQGEHYGTALALLDQRLAETPMDPGLRIFAAEVHVKAGDPALAVEILLDVQHMAGLDRDTDILVGHRLVDLFLGPIKEPARALVELRRIVVKYPDTHAATMARTALRQLKSEIVHDQGADATRD